MAELLDHDPPAERKRLLRRVEVAHELLSELPAAEDLSFLHSGLCQTCLPHSRPTENHAIWRRRLSTPPEISSKPPK